MTDTRTITPVPQTYHGITRAMCLTCNYEVKATDPDGIGTLELWNDYGVTCLRNDCQGASEWSMADGTLHTIDPEPTPTPGGTP